MMRWLLGAVAGLVGLVLVLWLVGGLLPRDHVARMTLDVRAGVDAVWALVSDFADTPRWRAAVAGLEMGDPVEGRMRFVEVAKQGRTPFEVMAQEAPSRQVVRVIDDGMPFGGTWTWELEPTVGGTRVTITEEGFVRNPVFRIMSRIAFPPTATMDAYLRDLARELGEDTEPVVLRKR